MGAECEQCAECGDGEERASGVSVGGREGQCDGAGDEGVLREIMGGRMFPATINGLERCMRSLTK